MVVRARRAWEQARRSGDDLYLDSVVLNLHGFYRGWERVFRHIADALDGDVPGGQDWHQRLLEQMAGEVPGVRPAVISDWVREALDEFRRFRHVVHHVYTFSVDPLRVARLVERLEEVWPRARAELEALGAYLQQCSNHIDAPPPPPVPTEPEPASYP